MANWLDKYEQGGLVLKKKTKDNFGKKANPNDVKASVGPDFVGLGYNTKGRNYSPAWGGQFQMGGSMPGAVGFTYARVAGSAPANGKYTKKTKASAQNGQEMKFYQEGLDFKPKSISKNGSAIKDDRGQWAYPGEITEIGSNDITMQGVNYPVLGVSDTGDTQMMYPDQDYKFDGEKVTEYPMAQNGIITNNPKDPRIKKYQDSLALYNQGLRDKQNYINVVKNAGLSTKYLETYDAHTNDKISPISQMGLNNRGGGYDSFNPNDAFTIYGKESEGDIQIKDKTPLGQYLEKHPLLYKKPKQPVKYQKSEPIPVVEVPKVEVKKVKGSKKYFINETEVDEPTFNKIVPKKEGMQNGGWLNKYK